jgi:hypothetical protein
MSIIEILHEKWFWIIIILLILIFVMPFIVIMLLVFLPYPLNTILTVCILVCWGIVSGYKDWITSKSEKEDKRKGKEET